MITTTKLLLFLGDKNCRAVWSKGGQFFDEQDFANDDDGRRQFAAVIAGKKKFPLAILTDLVEEDYRHEMVPHLGAGDRKRFFAKKLDQFFHHTQFRHALLQSSEEKNRDGVLYSALTAPEKIVPWLELIKSSEIPLTGIYSVAMLSTMLVEKTPFSHLLLLSFEKHGGLRQSFFLNDRLRFSRLTPLSINDDLVETVQSETGRIYKYLHTMNLIPGESPLIIGILCNSSERGKLEKSLHDSQTISHVYFDLNEIGKKIGYRPGISNSDSTALFFHLLTRKSIPNQYGASEHTRDYALWQWRRLSFSLSLLSFVIGALWTAANLSAGAAFYRESVTLDKRTQSITNSYRKFAAEFPRTVTTAESMKAAVSLANSLSLYSPQPSKLLATVSQALAPFPQIRLNHLSWQPADNPDAIKKGAASDAANPIEARLNNGKQVDQVIFIGGEIFPFDHNYRAAIDIINRFTLELQKKGMAVSVEKLPIDLDPGASLSGSRKETDGARADFMLKTVWKEKP